MNSLIVAAVLLAAVPPDESSPAAPLGSAEFKAAPDRPFGWRGDGTGRFPGAAPATEWSPTQNVRWSAAVGRSYSSPIVAEGLVVVTSEPDLVIAVGRADGRERWRVRVAASDLPDAGERAAAEAYKPKDTGLAAATPVTDGAAVYAVFANGIVRAVDLGGRTKWTAFIDAPQNTQYGRSASPILTAGKLVVHMTNLYAFDPATGRRLWVNTDARCAYGTPAALRQDEVDLIVTPGGDVVRADDGKGVNSQIGSTSNASPVVLDGVIYFGEKDIRAIRLGAGFKDESLWNGEISEEVFGSPLLHDGLLFTATGKGELFVFDSRRKGAAEPVVDARELFGDEGPQPVAYSSFTLAGNHLFLNSTRGDIVVIEATREARAVAVNRLREGSGAAPVFSGKDMFLRDGDRLFCIGK